MSLFSTRIRNFNFFLSFFSMDTRIKPSYLITLQRGIAEQVWLLGAYMYYSSKEMKILKNKIKSLPVGLWKFSHVSGNQQSIFHGLIMNMAQSSFVVKSFTNCRTTNFFVGLAEICILSVLCLTENLRYSRTLNRTKSPPNIEIIIQAYYIVLYWWWY
jgi:hypothetical protein